MTPAQCHHLGGAAPQDCPELSLEDLSRFSVPTLTLPCPSVTHPGMEIKPGCWHNLYFAVSQPWKSRVFIKQDESGIFAAPEWGAYFKQTQNGLTRFIRPSPPAPGSGNVLGTVTINRAVSKQGIITTVKRVLLVQWRRAEMDEEEGGAGGSLQGKAPSPSRRVPRVCPGSPSPPRV